MLIHFASCLFTYYLSIACMDGFSACRGVPDTAVNEQFEARRRVNGVTRQKGGHTLCMYLCAAFMENPRERAGPQRRCHVRFLQVV